ncbi:MAG: MOSC domain-containing protein [Pedobacter sp.]|nr:MAG: MOSC domain-containing protein [Pedobacter sp.]
MNQFILSEINIYPVKSLGGISLQEAYLENRGLKYDRQWMLVDDNHIFITQRKHFELALLQVSVSGDTLTVSHKHHPDQKISFHENDQSGHRMIVTIWDDKAAAYEVSASVSDWFSNILNMSVKLVKMAADENRAVDPKFAAFDNIVGFADDYPCLIIGQSSLDDLNQKLNQPVPMNRFRPNFVFTGGDPYAEDGFADFYIGDIKFSAVKPCARCVLTTVNQQTGVKGQEPLRTLAKYRTVNKKVMFGQNLIHNGEGLIRLGQELNIITRK